MNNVAASVRARLLNVAKAQGVDFTEVLMGLSGEFANDLSRGRCGKRF